MSHAAIEPLHRKEMNEIAALLDGALNPEGVDKVQTGFVLLVFDFKAGSRMNYISNAERADMRVALRELLANFEGRMMPDAKGQ